MKRSANKQGQGLVSSVAMAYLILVLHLVLAAGVGLTVIFFRGLVSYMGWILAGFFVMVGLSALMFYRRLKSQGRTVADALRDPVFGGRSVEVRLLGGLASIKIGSAQQQSQQDASLPLAQAPKRLEDASAQAQRQLDQLTALLEQKLISAEQFLQAKRRLLGGD